MPLLYAGAALTAPFTCVCQIVLPVFLLSAYTVSHSQPTITLFPTTSGEDSLRPGSGCFQI
jgi:hypothetical protein